MLVRASWCANIVRALHAAAGGWGVAGAGRGFVTARAPGGQRCAVQQSNCESRGSSRVEGREGAGTRAALTDPECSVASVKCGDQSHCRASISPRISERRMPECVDDANAPRRRGDAGRAKRRARGSAVRPAPAAVRQHPPASKRRPAPPLAAGYKARGRPHQEQQRGHAQQPHAAAAAMQRARQAARPGLPKQRQQRREHVRVQQHAPAVRCGRRRGWRGGSRVAVGPAAVERLRREAAYQRQRLLGAVERRGER